MIHLVGEMVPLQSVLPEAMAALLARQPLSPGKVALAWRLAVGPLLARVATVRLGADGVLEVRTTDARWREELERASGLIQRRLATILGEGTVGALDIR
jgi:hypothetical protein